MYLDIGLNALVNYVMYDAMEIYRIGICYKYRFVCFVWLVIVSDFESNIGLKWMSLLSNACLTCYIVIIYMYIVEVKVRWWIW